MIKELKTIAVDLTPVLPGGENGGAKIFILELLKLLAEKVPKTRFVLLTQAISHEELAVMDCSNMQRAMVLGPAITSYMRPQLIRFTSYLLSYLPSKFKNGLIRWRYGLTDFAKNKSTKSLLRAINADLLFCPFTAPTYFEPGVPTVCTIYDLQYKTYPEFFGAEELAQRDRAFMDACRRATALTAISDYSRNSVIAHGKIDPNKIRTIYLRMAKRIKAGSTQENSILSWLGLTYQRYLTYPANFWKHKNHEMLLASFGMACHGGLARDIKLVCTGAPGTRQEWLVRAARAMNLADRVIFPGFLTDSEMTSLMAGCSGVVFPSLYEGFGLPIIEAMALGVPVACSNTTSLPEVAADAALLFDPRIPCQISQAILMLVGDESLRTRLVKAGYQRAAEFSDSERMASEYWEVFQHALNNEKLENQLTGAFSDGWAGSNLRIQVAPSSNHQTLEVELFAPNWLPQPSVKIHTNRNGKSQGVSLRVARGSKAVVSLAIDPSGGCYEIRISPTFIPAHADGNGDQRELSVMVQRCGISCANGECIELFPEINR